MIKGAYHFLDILRIIAVLVVQILAHCIHVQIIVLHDVQLFEDALREAGAGNGATCSQIHNCLLLRIGHLEARLLGAAGNDIIVPVGMLAALMDVILVNGIGLIAVNFECAGKLFKIKLSITIYRLVRNLPRQDRRMLWKFLDAFCGSTLFFTKSKYVAFI